MFYEQHTYIQQQLSEVEDFQLWIYKVKFSTSDPNTLDFFRMNGFAFPRLNDSYLFRFQLEILFVINFLLKCMRIIINMDCVRIMAEGEYIDIYYRMENLPLQ